ncbi:Protein roadkill (Hh-induced MATH and BTB domain-containing protein) [Durusdinium trenchii]|uniref:Protein roadkill (Hh-induced MATH and BTB domain-containing protein) n=1 Tax=Durusdinium trenchii TaxID=1381693 RepID=A0ABP0HJM3_9DINO
MAGSLLADLSRMGSENAFTDLLLTAQGGHQREANCVILAARSNVFKQMLSSEMQEGQLRSGKRHVHLHESPEVLDHLLEWCYADTLRDLDLLASMELLKAADCFEIRGLLQKCSQRVSKLLTAELLPEAITLAQQLSCSELWKALATFVAKDEKILSRFSEAPFELRSLALSERKKILEKNLVELRLRLAHVPAPRPAIVFWRQSFSEAQQDYLVREALESRTESVSKALFQGYRDNAPAHFREACARRWKDLDDQTRCGFEVSALEDEEKSQHSKEHLEQQLIEVSKEIKSVIALQAEPDKLDSAAAGCFVIVGHDVDSVIKRLKMFAKPSASHDSSTKPEPPDVPESMGLLTARDPEPALRLYYHAKWLAERNHATAAEWRYREASRLALQTRRKVLAAHALGRFGYFLIHWNRRHEAKEVLRESRRISSKSKAEWLNDIGNAARCLVGGFSVRGFQLVEQCFF